MSVPWQIIMRELSEADVPEQCDDNFDTVELPCGWKVQIFYDCGEVDYIDELTAPSGETIDPWQWAEGTPGKAEMIAWRGNS